MPQSVQVYILILLYASLPQISIFSAATTKTIMNFVSIRIISNQCKLLFFIITNHYQISDDFGRKKMYEYLRVDDNFKLMEVILGELQNKKCWKSFMKTQCRRNGIDPGLASTFTIVKMRKFYQKLTNTQLADKPRMKSSVWLENELKAYQWLLVALSGCAVKLIADFVYFAFIQRESEWRDMSAIFDKEESVLQYQAIKLISERSSVKRKWQQDETTILQKIIRENPLNNKWNEIARKLFDLSDKKYFRSGKQCRQRWYNHLDPQKKHGQWDHCEDRFIAEFILEKGRKWSEIAKKLENQRTEHMVKNRYKTMIIKLRKMHKDIKTQNQLLKKLITEDNQNQEEQPLQIQGLPIMESQGEQKEELDFQNYGDENVDKVPSSFRDCQFQQVVTPCPIIYQSFTPTFLNTPHPLPFLMNYSFDQFQKNQNLFLKNN